MSGRAGAVAALSRETLPELSWRKGAGWRGEVGSGVAGAVLVIPQAITFSYLAGLPPEYGLYCAVFVALVSSLFGSCAMVGGPNTAMSILIGLAVMPHAGRGSTLYTEYVLLLTLAVGVLQLGFWLMRMATVFRHLSPAAIGGIKIGVGVLLITSSLEGTLGVSGLSMQFFHEKFMVVIASREEIVNPFAATISAITIASALLLRRWLPRSHIIAALLAGWAAGAAIDGWVGPAHSQVELLGRIVLQPLPWHVPSFSREHLLVLEELLPSAVAIAVLGLAQSLVIARDLKLRHNPDTDLHKEVFAQGLSNVAGAFMSCFAGSGSFNRTSVAIGMGARSQLSGIVSSVAVLVIAWGCAPALTRLPMPAIAAVLFLVGMGMIQWQEIRLFARHRADLVVCWLTALTVCFVGLEAGLAVAAIASVAFFVAGASAVALETSQRDGVEYIAVRGNLFYASVDTLARHLRQRPGGQTRLDLRRVAYCDAAALAVIEGIRRERLEAGGQLNVVREDPKPARTAGGRALPAE